MNKFFLGIDPGIEGAISLLKNTTIIKVINIPFKKPTRSLEGVDKKFRGWFYKREIDSVELTNILLDEFKLGGINLTEAIIEDVNIIKGNTSKKSLLTIGKNYGAVVSVFDLLHIPLSPINPKKWKGVLGVTSDKETSIRYCKNLFGDQACARFGLDIDDNRAESVLIALYGREMKNE